jgi:mono/diheme cytochrome c family protein
MLRVLQRRARLVVAAVVFFAIPRLLTAQQQPPQQDAGGYKAPTAALERGRTVYVLNHCHFCHGTDLTQATMGAANLVESALVGFDQDGKSIGPLVRAGLPNLQTAMPSYRDLTAEEMVDLARYIHFLRQQAKYKELVLTTAQAPAGNAQAGRTYFNGVGNCAACHSPVGDLAGISRKYDSATPRSRLLRPGPAMPVEGAAVASGHAAHLRLLENYTRANVDNLLAYLQTLMPDR